MKKDISREEKEKLYKLKMKELQMMWDNPYEDDIDFSNWTNEQLDKGLGDIIGQLQYEKSISIIKKIFSFLFWIFVILGITGLLVFGIKQLL